MATSPRGAAQQLDDPGQLGGTELPPQRFEFRPGVKGFPRFRGINREVDPAAIPPNQFHLLENVRLEQNEIHSRPGQEKHGAIFTGAVRGIFAEQFQFGMVGADTRFYFTDPGLGLHHVFACTSTSVTEVESASPARSLMCAVAHNGKVYLGGSVDVGGVNDSSQLWVLDPLNLNTGITSVAVTGNSAEYFWDLYSHIDGNLYLGSFLEGANPAILWKWDGASLTAEDSIETSGSVRIAGLGAELFVVYGEGGDPNVHPNTIKQRVGSTWSTLSMPAGVARFSCHDTLTFNGSVFFAGEALVSAPYPAGQSALIIQWDGSSLTVPWIKHPSVLGVTSVFVAGMAEFANVMYFAWQTQAANVVRVGSQSTGGVFTDEVVNLSSQFPVLMPGQISRVWGFDSFFYFHGVDSTAGGKGLLLRAPLGNVGGAYTNVTTTILGALGGNEGMPNTLRAAVI